MTSPTHGAAAAEPPRRPRRGTRTPCGAASVATLLTLLLVAGCTEPEPRRLDSLVERQGRYLDPERFTPYSGPVVSMYRGSPDAVEMRATLVEGRLHGPYERYYRSGATFGTGAYRRGTWDGPFESFYEDGTPWMRGSYEAGVLDGPYAAYAEDGRVQEEGTYDEGEPCGTWVRDGDTIDHPDCPEG